MPGAITVTLTIEEVQYVLNSIDTHVKHHGLGVALMGVTILAKLQAANKSTGTEDQDDTKEDIPKEGKDNV